MKESGHCGRAIAYVVGVAPFSQWVSRFCSWTSFSLIMSPESRHMKVWVPLCVFGEVIDGFGATVRYRQSCIVYLSV